MRALPSLAVRFPVTMTMVFAGVLILGWISLDKLPVDLLPDISSPKIIVVLESGNRPPREMEDVYGEQLESQLSTIRGVKSVSSVSRVGSILLTVEFFWDTEMDFALLEVQKNIGYLQGEREVDNLTIRRFDAQAAPILTLCMLPEGEEAGAGQAAGERGAGLDTGGYTGAGTSGLAEAAGGRGADLDELRRLAEDYVRPALERLPGVAAVRISGGREREVIVETDELLLDAFGIDVDDVVQRIEEANVDTSGGTLVEEGKVYVIKGVGEFRDLDEIRDLTVAWMQPGGAAGRTASGASLTGSGSSTAGLTESGTTGGSSAGRLSSSGTPLVPVPLSRVARVYLGDKEVRNLVRLDGREGVGLAVHKEGGSNTVQVSEAVQEALEGLARSLPGVRFEVVREQARFITTAIGEVKDQALIGALLAVAVLFLFLRNLRATAIIALAIPLSIVATFVTMYFAGLSLNIMTLGGLALGVGMLVDNAIVVIENIYRHLQAGRGAMEAAVEGTAEVAGAITSTTLTTVVVFLPVVFLGDVTGELLREQAFTVSISLLCSLVVALLLIPMLASRFLRARQVLGTEHVVRSGVYRRIQEGTLRRKWTVAGTTLLLALLSLEGLRRAGTEFIPRTDPGEFGIRLVLPEGTPVAKTSQVAAFAEGLLRENFGQSIRAVYCDVGQRRQEDELLSEEVWDENTALVEVSLRPQAERGAVDSAAILAAIDPVLRQVPDLEVTYRLAEGELRQTIGTGGAPVAVEVRGPDVDRLREITGQAAAQLEEMRAAGSGVYNVRTSFQGGREEVSLELDRLAAAGVGLDTATVARLVQRKLEGEEITTFRAEDEERDISLRHPRMGLDELLALEVENPAGARVLLRDIARAERTTGPREILRRGQSRTGLVMADLEEGATLSSVMGDIRARMDGLGLARGYRYLLGGEELRRQESFATLRFALLLALLLVYMVMAAQFESFLHPFTVMLTIPMAGIGVSAFFYLLGEPLSVMAFIGIIILTGIAVDNGILLIDFTNTLRRRGMGRREALLAAGQARLRPILMTSLTTILGVLPLALGIGEGAELRAPLAWALLSGLIAATALTLVVLPVVYDLIDRLRPARMREGAAGGAASER